MIYQVTASNDGGFFWGGFSVYVACALAGAFCSLVLFLVGGVFCGGRLSSTLIKTLKSLVTVRPWIKGVVMLAADC